MARNHCCGRSAIRFAAICLLGIGVATRLGPAVAQVAQVPETSTQVDLELILAVDVSGSMDGEEQRFQRAGYLAAIPHPDVVRAIQSGPNRRISLTYVEWAGHRAQAVTVPWRIVSDKASAEAFAAHLAQTPVAFLRETSIASILDYSQEHFAQSGVRGLKRVIDVSGDGPNNHGSPVSQARDRIVAQGIVINGLPMMLEAVYGMKVGLDQYYRDCVIGGPGAFVLPVLRKDDWSEAIRRKLVLEIASRPMATERLATPDVNYAPPVHQAQLRPLVPDSSPAIATDCLVGEQLRRLWDP